MQQIIAVDPRRMLAVRIICIPVSLSRAAALDILPAKTLLPDIAEFRHAKHYNLINHLDQARVFLAPFFSLPTEEKKGA